MDNDHDGAADPGYTLRYTITITNVGNLDATDVYFSDTIDANTTLVGGSVSTTPIARNDSYTRWATSASRFSASDGVLANDDDPDGDSISVTRQQARQPREVLFQLAATVLSVICHGRLFRHGPVHL
ncbi:MAG: DUF11 domain-containing protein [Chloroflexota bacterium]